VIIVISGCASVRPIVLSPLQQESIHAAAIKAVPETIGIDVSAIKKVKLNYPTVIISGHLLENEMTENSSPYVRGEYGTREKLTRVAMIRAYRILKSVLSEANTASVSELEVHVYHGVRVSTVRVINGIKMSPAISDVTTLIYGVSINIELIPSEEWIAMDPDIFMNTWIITKNIIPTLEFYSIQSN
jgi:hypothetical protein